MVTKQFTYIPQNMKSSFTKNSYNVKLLRVFTNHKSTLHTSRHFLCTTLNISLRHIYNLVVFSPLVVNPYYPFYFESTQQPIKYLLSLNFKRLRFFPGFKTTSGQDFTHLSLGLLNAQFKKGKFFVKSKIVYLALASFFRKILLFAGIKNFFLHIHRSPKYFLEILNTLLEPVIGSYNNPFKLNSIINEQS